MISGHSSITLPLSLGRFRQDLFYRLHVYPIALPPLCERQEDIGPLTMCFRLRCSRQLRKEVPGLSKDAWALFARYPWPGKVRELEEVMEQAVARCQGPTVTAQDLPQALWEQARVPVWSGGTAALPSGRIAPADSEQQRIRQALEQAQSNTSQAAKLWG